MHLPFCHTGAFRLGWMVSEFVIQLPQRESQPEHELPLPGAARGFLGTAGMVFLPISHPCREAMLRPTWRLRIRDLCPSCLAMPLSFFFFFNVYLFVRDRERQSVSGGGAEGEGGAESEAGSRLRAVSAGPDPGLEPPDHDLS